jgi:hypothetical protein
LFLLNTPLYPHNPSSHTTLGEEGKWRGREGEEEEEEENGGRRREEEEGRGGGGGKEENGGRRRERGGGGGGRGGGEGQEGRRRRENGGREVEVEEEERRMEKERGWRKREGGVWGTDGRITVYHRYNWPLNINVCCKRQLVISGKGMNLL